MLRDVQFLPKTDQDHPPTPPMYMASVLFFFFQRLSACMYIQSFKKNNKRFAFVSFKLEGIILHVVCVLFALW